MGMYKRGPTWWISFTYNGRQVRRSTETNDRKLAEKIHHKVMTEVIEGKYFAAPIEEASFEELADDLLDDYRINLRKSISRTEINVKHLKGQFKGMKGSEITSAEIEWRLIRRDSQPEKREGRSLSRMSLCLFAGW